METDRSVIAVVPATIDRDRVRFVAVPLESGTGGRHARPADPVSLASLLIFIQMAIGFVRSNGLAPVNWNRCPDEPHI
jgi:hypothetical protein